MDADRVPRGLLWKHGDRATPRQHVRTADGQSWFSPLTIAGSDHRPLALTVYVADRPQTFSTVWLHLLDGRIPTQREIDACTRALNILHLGRKMDIVGAEVPDEGEEGIGSLHMDFVPHLSCVDAGRGLRSAFCIRRRPGTDGNLALICTVRDLDTHI